MTSVGSAEYLPLSYVLTSLVPRHLKAIMPGNEATYTYLPVQQLYWQSAPQSSGLLPGGETDGSILTSCATVLYVSFHCQLYIPRLSYYRLPPHALYAPRACVHRLTSILACMSCKSRLSWSTMAFLAARAASRSCWAPVCCRLSCSLRASSSSRSSWMAEAFCTGGGGHEMREGGREGR